MTTTQAPQDFLTTLATTHPDKLAVVEDLPDGTIRHWSYAEFEANACRLARVLIAEGVGAKDRVIWCGQNSPWVVALMAAARKLGAVAVPLNYRLTAEEAAYVVDNSDAAVAFIDAELQPLFEGFERSAKAENRFSFRCGAPGPCCFRSARGR